MLLKHTQDSLKLTEFLEKYPNRWHGYATDKRTLKALARAKVLNFAIQTNDFNQMRLDGKWSYTYKAR